MIFSFEKPKSQMYRTAQTEAVETIQNSKNFMNLVSGIRIHSHNSPTPHIVNSLTKKIYKIGSDDYNTKIIFNPSKSPMIKEIINPSPMIKEIINPSPMIKEIPNPPLQLVNEKKILILFVYHIYNDRVKKFIQNCIFYDENIDFIIISNNKNNNELNDIINVTNVENKNVKMLFRDNVGYDFGGWSDALLTNNLYEKYNNFIFVNSSVTGPFLRPGHKGKWTDIYINGLQGNVKLFGSTINNERDPLKLAHVQSYIFSMDKTTLKFLIDCSIFSISKYAKTFDDAIHNKEILMSRKIIENNWNIGSLMKCYKNVDFTFRNKKPKDYNISFFNDVMYPMYRNKIWNEYELVFIKGNRSIMCEPIIK